MVCTSMVFQDVREEQNHYRMAAVEREQTVKQTLDTRQIWNLEYIDMKESKELRKSNSGQHSQSERPVQHVFLVGAKSLGAYGGYETFINKLTEYHQNNQSIKYHVACKANGPGCMDERTLAGVSERVIKDGQVVEFTYHNAH